PAPPPLPPGPLVLLEQAKRPTRLMARYTPSTIRRIGNSSGYSGGGCGGGSDVASAVDFFSEPPQLAPAEGGPKGRFHAVRGRIELEPDRARARPEDVERLCRHESLAEQRDPAAIGRARQVEDQHRVTGRAGLHEEVTRLYLLAGDGACLT